MLLAWIAGALLIGIIVLFLARNVLRRWYREVIIARASELFFLQRERLEAKFFELASACGKPKGLRWENIEFHSPTRFVRDRKQGQLTAFTEITISFSAIEGGGMEEVAAVHERRNATAVFHYHHGYWGTGGRVLFNMSPADAIDHFGAEFEPIATAS